MIARRRLFLAAYACSGFAALVYQVTWTRLLSLHLGHTTAAAATVVAAFMGGLAFGSFAWGRLAPRLSPRRTLFVYAALEAFAAAAALSFPSALSLVQPALAWGYGAAPGPLFPVIRLAVCILFLVPPAVALGGTFPLAVKWLTVNDGRPGLLYAVNTAGGALGALTAGFVLLPLIGLSRTTALAASAGAVSIVAALLLAARSRDWHAPADRAGTDQRRASRRARNTVDHATIAAAILALTGFSTFVHEIVWARIFAMILGPSTYAFAATLAVIVTGTAAGAMVGSALASHLRRPALALCVALGTAALAAGLAGSFAGTSLPWRTAQAFASSGSTYADLLVSQFLWVALLVGPTAVCLGIAFPLTLELAADSTRRAADRIGALYAVNTVAGVAGALLAAFLFIPRWGLEMTLDLGTIVLIAAATIVILGTASSFTARCAAALPIAAAAAIVLLGGPWDRKLLASGAYKYSAQFGGGVDLRTRLTAGSLLYYKEGPSGTVTVRRQTGTTSLAIDGKVDASNASDMVTQKLLAHLPLLLHAAPQRLAIVGLGSGVTVGAALQHPVTAVDVLEISPEVVEASRFFDSDNGRALDDPRVRLIQGDGRSHMFLSSASYDVIISEPSNPWMAGVASLFTREFFDAVRERLSPGGVFCQWAHTYDLSAADLRSIVGTFADAFPDATMWLVGEGDLLLIGALDGGLAPLANIERAWTRPDAARDLRSVSIMEPFGVLSLFAGHGSELASFAAGAPLQTDDRLALEFSGPWALNAPNAGDATALDRMIGERELPHAIQQAFASARADEWTHRGRSMMRIGAHERAYDDFARALAFDAGEATALDGLVDAALAVGRVADARAMLEGVARSQEGRNHSLVLVALSRLLARNGELESALQTAAMALSADTSSVTALEQLASLYADLGHLDALDLAATDLRARFPASPAAAYYSATARFLHGDLDAAASLAQRSIEADASSAPAHNLLGAIYATIGRTDEAARALTAALALDPRDPSIYVNLGRLALSRGDSATAGEWFAEAVLADPHSTMARDGLARATQFAGR